MLIRMIVFLMAFFMATTFSLHAQKKELCEVEVEGINYSLHLVEVGDNLFRIAQKYNSTVMDIFKNNPAIMDSIIIPGQVLKVPVDSKIKKPFANEINTTVSQSVASKIEPIKIKLDSTKVVYHEVEKGQTLYSISRKYSISIEELKSWNKMEDNNIKLGQKLIVSPYGSVKMVEFDKGTGAKEEKIVMKEIEPSSTPVKQTIEVNNQLDNLQQAYAQSASGKSEVIERGAAAWIPTGSSAYANKYLALHRTAPIGTVVKVTNLINKKYAFVKVIGKLPDTGDNKDIQIRLSESAKNDLVLLDGKSLVQIQYYK